jgi:hypothetical protein
VTVKSSDITGLKFTGTDTMRLGRISIAKAFMSTSIDAGITGIDAASLPPGYVMIQIVTAQTAYVMRVLR